ncbi:hypothetical protein EOT50_11920 [Listeria monocytogenes]|nr:hypothetical protein [Listeria monocytogenes]EAD4729124.1 hypothetical protein [Listeria monocytogenes]
MAIQAFFNAVGANSKKLKKTTDIYKRPSEADLKRAENSNTLDKKLEQQKALEDFTKQLDLSQLK